MGMSTPPGMAVILLAPRDVYKRQVLQCAIGQVNAGLGPGSHGIGRNTAADQAGVDRQAARQIQQGVDAQNLVRQFNDGGSAFLVITPGMRGLATQSFSPFIN